MLGILKKGQFKDFYYSSGIKYETFQQYIPSSFVEVMESTYEYHPKAKLTPEEYIKQAFSILEACGYKRLPD